MAEYDGISQYRKAAPRRLRDAEELLQGPTLAPEEQGADTRHLRASVYLAGYAVECVLKAYLIQQCGVTSLRQVVERRRGKGEDVPDILGDRGHSLPLLLSLSGLEEQLDLEEDRKRDWGTCLRWNSTWRYDPSVPTPEFARGFVDATRRIYQWVENRL